MARDTEPAPCASPTEDRAKPSKQKEATPMIHLAAHAAGTAYAWIASLQFPAVESKPRRAPQQPPMPRSDRVESVRLDRATARAMVDAGFMPLSRYIQMFEADDDEPSCVDALEH
jgi:hypothetical protein